MAQRMIEGVDDGGGDRRLYGPHTWPDVAARVRSLHALATELRAARFASGALRLDNAKICFQLGDDGQPVSASPYVIKDSNRLGAGTPYL